ncbi:hypothetical protein [Oceanobacillus sp. J11TS1]|uniref:hypothetical protein n=1 Tax=Oceanobacillus sp. J11TS1 TaxID=2807191 RepID=UPI001B2CC3B8|nr:hypothetical protein [Oceanobacillus sp. J11TS1]GIO24155.1 hypothetical protein J11TS1_27360 [Oceanobacillus sp. J11TS1]
MNLASDGGGGNGFKFNKSLPDNVGKTINELEESFHQVFGYITYFQEKLDQQSGKAASSLKTNLNKHLELMGKSAPVLLNFVDVMKHFMLAMEAADEGNSVINSSTARAEWQYSLSSERIEDEVKVDEDIMREAALSFKFNVTNIEELFLSFKTMINEVISETNLPWDDFTSIWFEAEVKIESIVEKTKEHIEQLLKEVEAFVQEIVRLDTMASRIEFTV